MIVRARSRALPNGPDSVAMLKVLHRDVEFRALLTQDVLLQACFLVLLQVAVVRRAAA